MRDEAFWDRIGSVLKWRLSIAESLAMAGTAVAIALWAFGTFTSKSEAEETKRVLTARTDALETQMERLTRSVAEIGENVAYIRGRLEPKR